MAEIFQGIRPRIGDIVRNGFDIKNFEIVEIYNPKEVGIIEVDADPRCIQKVKRVDVNSLYKR